jgi:adenosylmethionine-8-amino-7-oxononanoate aminotransferase
MVTVAKGLTAGYAPMGATLVGARVVEVVNRPGAVLNHGYTFAGHPLSAAIALRTLEIMERDRILRHVRDLEDHLAKRMASLAELPIVGDVRGAGFFYACELTGDADNGGFTDVARDAIVAELIPRRLREAGLLARVYNRDAPLLQIAPPLISDRHHLDRIADILGETLDEASRILVRLHH